MLWGVGALAIGSLRATNTWDWPTYLLLGSVAVVYYVWRSAGQFDLRTAGRAGLLIVLGLAGLFDADVLAFRRQLWHGLLVSFSVGRVQHPAV